MSVMAKIKARIEQIEKLQVHPKSEPKIMKYLGDIENALDQIREEFFLCHDKVCTGDWDWPKDDKWTTIAEINDTR